MKNNMAEVEEQRQIIIDFIRDYFYKNGGEFAIIGISGGKDSTIAAALLVDALGNDRVIGVLMPEGEQADIEDAYRVRECLEIAGPLVNINSICEAFYKEVQGLNKQIIINTPPRVRMAVLYAIASQFKGRVCNTSNRSEIFLGYSTKWGDNVGDFSLFKNLTVAEILTLGEWYVQKGILPNELVYKAPADGLTGMTDEENMGITYSVVDNYILNDILPEFFNDYLNMMERHDRSKHKSEIIHLPAPRSLFSGGSFEF